MALTHLPLEKLVPGARARRGGAGRAADAHTVGTEDHTGASECTKVKY